MITKRVILNQVEILRIGHIQLRFTKEVVEDGNVLSSDYHRTLLECGCDIDAQMKAVNAHLKSIGWPAVAPEEYAEVKEYAKIKWTPTKLAEWNTIKSTTIMGSK